MAPDLEACVLKIGPAHFTFAFRGLRVLGFEGANCLNLLLWITGDASSFISGLRIERSRDGSIVLLA